MLRLFSASKPLPLSEMGLMPYNLDRFRGLLEKPYGIILCVGPTGSGKTTTLHSALGGGLPWQMACGPSKWME